MILRIFRMRFGDAEQKPPPDGGDKGLFDQFGKVLDEIIPEEDGRRGKVAAFPPGKIDVAAAVGGGNGH